MSFCLPVKKGWHLEQVSRRSSLRVLRVTKVSPQAQTTVTCWYSGWILGFITLSGDTAILSHVHPVRKPGGSSGHLAHGTKEFVVVLGLADLVDEQLHRLAAGK